MLDSSAEAITFDVRRRNLTDTLNGGPGSHGPSGFMLALLLTMGALLFLWLDQELRARIVGAIVRMVGFHALWAAPALAAAVLYRLLRVRQERARDAQIVLRGKNADL